MERFQSEDFDIYYEEYGDPSAQVILWAHGWGQSHKSFEKLISSIEKLGRHVVIDFPGFGQSPEPKTDWSTEDYADALATFIKSKTSEKVIWIGHSFGCRVGIQVASRHPELLSSMCLISGAGLPRKRPLYKKLYFKAKIMTYKALKKLSLLKIISKEWLSRKFGSADYNNTSGILRQIFLKVVNEDLSAQAQTVSCPTLLIYGENDRETPPEIGMRLKALIKDSEMVHLAGQDHYSVLGDGRHQVAPLIKRLIEKTSQT